MTGPAGLRTAVGLRAAVGAMTLFFHPGFLFRVPTARGDVYMRVDRREWRNELRSVVEVDAVKFLARWGCKAKPPKMSAGAGVQTNDRSMCAVGGLWGCPYAPIA